MYDHYLQMAHIPTGAILDRILTKERFSCQQLSERSGVLLQVIMDYITNRRRITIDDSRKLEKALGISTSNFFYKIQANYDAYSEKQSQLSDYHPELSIYRKALFWDTTIDKLDWEKNRHWIIRRVFEYGGDVEIQETVRFYGKDIVLQELNSISDLRRAEIRLAQIENYLHK